MSAPAERDRSAISGAISLVLGRERRSRSPEAQARLRLGEEAAAAATAQLTQLSERAALLARERERLEAALGAASEAERTSQAEARALGAQLATAVEQNKQCVERAEEAGARLVDAERRVVEAEERRGAAAEAERRGAAEAARLQAEGEELRTTLATRSEEARQRADAGGCDESGTHPLGVVNAHSTCVTPTATLRLGAGHQHEHSSRTNPNSEPRPPQPSQARQLLERRRRGMLAFLTLRLSADLALAFLEWALLASRDAVARLNVRGSREGAALVETRRRAEDEALCSRLGGLISPRSRHELTTISPRSRHDLA